MKIAVNTRLLLKDRLEGIGRFSMEVLHRITREHPEHEFLFLFDRPFSPEFIFSENITPMVLFPQARHPVLYYWWFEYSVAAALQRTGADVFLSPDGYLSLRSPVPQIQIIHDLNFEHGDYGIPWYELKYYRTMFPRYARKANRIATVSEFSKKDISQSYSIDAKKIDVIYNAGASGFGGFNPLKLASFRSKYAQGSNYFLYVGAIHPRKNITRLLKAFEAFKSNTGRSEKLILAGSKKWYDSEAESFYNSMTHRSDVLFTGRVSQPELQEITAAALASVNVSLYEGFGMPMLEAMHCNVPVLASETTALPEIAGDAALYANPENVESISNALTKISTDESLRREMIAKGRIRRQGFTWEKTSQSLWQSIERTIS